MGGILSIQIRQRKEAAKISDTYKTKPYDRNIMQKADSLISLAQELLKRIFTKNKILQTSR